MMEYGRYIDNVKINKASDDPCHTWFKTVVLSEKVIPCCHNLMHEYVDIMDWFDTV